MWTIEELIAKQRVTDLLQAARSPADRAENLDREAKHLRNVNPDDLPLRKPMLWLKHFS